MRRWSGERRKVDGSVFVVGILINLLPCNFWRYVECRNVRLSVTKFEYLYKSEKCHKLYSALDVLFLRWRFHILMNELVCEHKTVLTIYTIALWYYVNIVPIILATCTWREFT